MPPGALAYIDASVVVRTLMFDEQAHVRARDALAATTGRAATWTLTQVEATRLAAEWPVVFVTADHEQARAARAEGLQVVTV